MPPPPYPSPTLTQSKSQIQTSKSKTNPKFKFLKIPNGLLLLVTYILNLEHSDLFRDSNFACLRRNGYAQAGASNFFKGRIGVSYQVRIFKEAYSRESLSSLKKSVGRALRGRPHLGARRGAPLRFFYREEGRSNTIYPHLTANRLATKSTIPSVAFENSTAVATRAGWLLNSSGVQPSSR